MIEGRALRDYFRLATSQTFTLQAGCGSTSRNLVGRYHGSFRELNPSS